MLMYKKFTILMFCTLILVYICLQGYFDITRQGTRFSTPKRPSENHDTLGFMVLADWGGRYFFPYSTPIQLAVARQMAKVSEKYSPGFILALGDNFYAKGVKNVNDTRFQETFEDVYSSSYLFIPWYIVAGNHDYQGHVQAQIEYSNYSRRWRFPDYYYKQTEHIPGGKTLDIIHIDTVRLCGKTGKRIQPGPRNVTIAEEQWAWIEQQLKHSTADYLLVCGHAPVQSVGINGPTFLLVERLEPLLYQYGVGAYLSGHDHNMQHIQMKKSGQVINYFVTGTGAYVKEGKHHANTVPEGSLKYFLANSSSLGGFSYFDVSDTAMKLKFIDGTGKVRYQFEMEPRRSNRFL